MPVALRGVKPPMNLSWNIQVENVTGTTQVFYNLAWKENPDNNPDLLKGYLLYIKEANGEFTLYRELDKDILETEVKFTADFKKYLFALSAISNSGYESDMVEFVPTENDN